VTTTNDSYADKSWLRTAMRWHRPLMLLAALMAVTTVLSAAGLLFDDRTLVNSPIWLKPLKFSISIGSYAATWAWLLSLQRTPRRWMHLAGTVAALVAAIEMVIIIGQVFRGKMSHFNAETPLDVALFAVMGTSITVLWVCNLLQAIVLIRAQLGERPMTLAIRTGVLVSLAGMAVAFLMTSPKDDQLAAMRAGVDVTTIGGHSVGVADGGPGMPITGWSTTGGDLRIAHFVGIHALQLLPLLAFGLALAARRRPRLRAEGVRARLVLIGAAAYTGLLLLVTWQALRGQPLTSPDALTLGAFALIVAGTTIGVLVTLAGTRETVTKELERAA
jgi:hypothetical protein